MRAQQPKNNNEFVERSVMENFVDLLISASLMFGVMLIAVLASAIYEHFERK